MIRAAWRRSVWWLGFAVSLPTAAGPVQQHGPIDAGRTRVVLSAPAAIGGPRSERGSTGGPRFPLLPAGARNTLAPGLPPHPAQAAPGKASPVLAFCLAPGASAAPAAVAGGANGRTAGNAKAAQPVVRAAAPAARLQRLHHPPGAEPGSPLSAAAQQGQPAPASPAQPATAGPAPAAERPEQSPQ